jgi:predicted HicB family RNase H-like nuclease
MVPSVNAKAQPVKQLVRPKGSRPLKRSTQSHIYFPSEQFHKALLRMAAAQGVSLNRFMVESLQRTISADSAETS